MALKIKVHETAKPYYENVSPLKLPSGTWSNEGPYRIYNRKTGEHLTPNFKGPNGDPSWSVSVPPMKFASQFEASEMLKELFGTERGVKQGITIVKIIEPAG